MDNLRKLGGVAALYEAAAYVLGLVFFIFVVDYLGAVEPGQKVALIVNNQFNMHLTTLLIYVVFGALLVVLVLALNDRLKADAPAIVQTATVFGLIWAGLLIASGMVFNSGLLAVVDLYGKDPGQAASVWLAIDSVHNGLSGDGEVLGGLWSLLISWAALRSGKHPKALNYLGIVIGVAGILSGLPGLKMLVGVFSIVQIVWFVWMGLLLLRNNPSTAT